MGGGGQKRTLVTPTIMFFKWLQTVRTPAVCLRVPNHLVTLKEFPALEMSTSMWAKLFERVPRGPLRMTCLFLTVPVTGKWKKKKKKKRND